MMPTLKQYRVCLYGTVSLVALVYILTLAVLPPDGFFINDGGCKFVQMRGLLESGFRQVAIPWPGREIDPTYRYNPLPAPFGQIHEGRLYGFYSFPFAVASALPYRLMGPFGLYIIPFLSGVLLLPAVWQLAGLLPGGSRKQPLSVILVGLCTPVWFYSVTFWEHMPATCLVTWGALLTLRYCLQGNRRDLALSGVLCGFAVYFRDELYLFAASLLVTAIAARPRDWRGYLTYTAAVLSALAPLWIFNLAEFGTLLGLRLGSASPIDRGIGTHLLDRWQVVRVLLFNAHSTRWISITVTAPFLLLMMLFPRVSKRSLSPVAFALAGIGFASGLTVLHGHLTASRPVWRLLASNGLFAVSPILIFAFVRSRRLAPDPANDSDRAKRLVWQITLVYLLQYLILSPRANTAGIHWGCRLLLPLYPLMGAMASSTLEEWLARAEKRKRVMVAALLVAGLSVWTQVYALHLLRARKAFASRLNRFTANTPESTIVATGWFLPQELALNFYDKKVFLVKKSEELDSLRKVLASHGIRRFRLMSAYPLTGVPPKDKQTFDDGLNFMRVETTSVSL